MYMSTERVLTTNNLFLKCSKTKLGLSVKMNPFLVYFGLSDSSRQLEQFQKIGNSRSRNCLFIFFFF